MPVSPHIHDAATPAGTALLDLRPWRGRWLHLPPEAEPLWRRLRAGMPDADALHAAATELADRHRHVPHERLAEDLAALLDTLRTAGLLTGRPHRRPAPRAPAPPGGEPAAERAAGAVALAAALLLIHTVPQRWTLAACARLSRAAVRDATAEEGEAALHAVRRAARAWPGRCACLEESLGAFLAAAMCRRRVRLVLGCGYLPPAPHAWIEADGRPLGQEASGNAWPYTAVLRV